MFVDSHCHLEMESFDKDRDEVIKRSVKEGLSYILTVGTEARYFDRVTDMLDRYPEVYGAVGIHPHNSTEYAGDLVQTMTRYLTHRKIVALGEIGLDFFRNYSPKDSQSETFRAQLSLAKGMGLPVIIHSRNARDETLAILRDMGAGQSNGVIHCYSYDVPTAREALDMGYYISIPGTITYRKTEHLNKVVEYVPLDRLLAETDAPFLAPVPHRGKRNEPLFVKLTVAKIAAIRNLDINEVASCIRDNFVRLFLGKERGERT
jgi:TatD DNase family protein